MESSKNIYLEESVIQLADRFGTKIWTFQSKKEKKKKKKKKKKKEGKIKKKEEKNNN